MFARNAATGRYPIQELLIFVSRGLSQPWTSKAQSKKKPLTPPRFKPGSPGEKTSYRTATTARKISAPFHKQLCILDANLNTVLLEMFSNFKSAKHISLGKFGNCKVQERSCNEAQVFLKQSFRQNFIARIHFIKELVRNC